jgi:hypothetical protein
MWCSATFSKKLPLWRGHAPRQTLFLPNSKGKIMSDANVNSLSAAERERERIRQEIIDDLDEEIELELQEEGLGGGGLRV